MSRLRRLVSETADGVVDSVVEGLIDDSSTPYFVDDNTLDAYYVDDSTLNRYFTSDF